MSRREKREAESKPLKKVIIVIAIILLIVFIAISIINHINNARPENANLVINNNNITAKLKKNVIIEDDVIYVAKEDVKNFFDKYITQDKDTKKLITTYEKKIASIEPGNKTIVVNGSNKKINATLKEENDTIYLPMSELNDVYNIEINYNEKTNIITMDSLDREQTKAYAAKTIKIKNKPSKFSRTLEKVKKGNWLIYVSDSDKGWAKVRTQDGKLGYVKKSKISNFDIVRQAMKEEKQISGKVNMVWDYFSEYHTAPDRTGTTIKGINVVSPAFFNINSKGQFQENVGSDGEKYIKWAHNNGYKVWAMISSSSNEGIDTRSKILNSYETHQKLIDAIVDRCVTYKLDGVNIDFEYMYENDKDVFSRFIIELQPRMSEIGCVTTVDVTAPDGSATWSLCFDRNVIGDVADYIVFMAYDQNTGKKVGTTAGYNWVETNLKKFIETEEIKSNKIILAVPFYTKLWADRNGDITSKTVDMNEIDKTLPSSVERTWDDTLKQDYVEFTQDNATKKMWIEDAKSIKEKVSLINKYDLGGVAEWTKDRETDDIWEVIDKELNN